MKDKKPVSSNIILYKPSQKSENNGNKHDRELIPLIIQRAPTNILKY